MTTNEAMSKVNRGSHGDFFFFFGNSINQMPRSWSSH